MDLRILLFSTTFLLLSCSSAGKTEDLDNESSKPIEAKTLFTIHCATCHGEKGDQGTSGAANLVKSNFSDSEIKNVILNGNEKGMMPYKDIITNKEEINSLVDFVKSLRK